MAMIRVKEDSLLDFRECNLNENEIKTYHTGLIELIATYDSLKSRISDEGIITYLYTRDEYRKGNVSKKHLYQFIFRSSYRLDGGGLTQNYKEEYFEILDKYRDLKKFCFSEIYSEFKSMSQKRDKNVSAFQGSFISKLLHTVNDNFPIYDSNVVLALKLNVPNQKEKDIRAKSYNTLIGNLYEAYMLVSQQKEFKQLKSHFFQQHKNIDLDKCNISDVKIIDFILWAEGDRLKEVDRMEVKEKKQQERLRKSGKKT